MDESKPDCISFREVLILQTPQIWNFTIRCNLVSYLGYPIFSAGVYSQRNINFTDSVCRGFKVFVVGY